MTATLRTIRAAVAALGPDLAGGSLTDLVLDQLPELRTVAHARQAIAQDARAILPIVSPRLALAVAVASLQARRHAGTVH